MRGSTYFRAKMDSASRSSISSFRKQALNVAKSLGAEIITEYSQIRGFHTQGYVVTKNDDSHP